MNPIDISAITSEQLRAKAYLASFPEYYELASVIENSLWHNNQNVLDHMIGVFEGLEKILKFENVSNSQKSLIKKYLSEVIGNKTRLEILTVATLLHDIAKIDVFVKRPDGTAGCPGHELIAAGRVKNFAERFDLDDKAESYVERIVRYHGFISEILNLMIASGNREKYLTIFTKTVGDISIELILLMHADLLGCDLEQGDKKGYDDRIDFLGWMLQKQLKEMK
ncbi:MAG: hypothetical protein A2383_02680 [Candidatus Pacebacteria bacterium RIFOXYB1_FULL_39_46]|nr:MAG: hypothetical protein A2383_02680 [Candidatus Pacebacteria bacterium RIFOXYB1_FULL_39_46]OGJ39287.1 MAG: hypothetical protein A2182_02945 [Candidatus Pacebacteria bacterium RIFOXYA1_FULL_38_18]OGJ40967.1 MAG: hypothetical protein A2582_01605 [Candidatus Pacebacteria bacterium RIFOXYD1_FULL_39_27]OGJ41148.1 MAG: hypothetical protein A2411_01525 [Candidatus Pacebacteria bacterium RIFOXYC1_FULL_39_21]